MKTKPFLKLWLLSVNFEIYTHINQHIEERCEHVDVYINIYIYIYIHTHLGIGRFTEVNLSS